MPWLIRRRFFFGKRGIDVEHKRINARAKLRDDKRNLVDHEARNKMHVTAQPIELSDGNGAFLAANLRLPARGSIPLDRYLAPICTGIAALVTMVLLWFAWKARTSKIGPTSGG